MTTPDRVVIDRLLARLGRELKEAQRFPEATYRLQFHARFTFRDAERLAPYLRDLGITHCYASPYLKARPGSTHGYDITDHRVLNPEIGTEADYDAWVQALHAHGLGQVLDTVPNHMGIIGNENPWWNDVLENGPSSPYAGFFDIAWSSSPRPELNGKVLLPVLGDPYGKVLESQQLRLRYADGTFTAEYFDHRFPVAPRSFGLVLNHRLDELARMVGAEAMPFIEYQSILTAISHLPRRTETDPEKVTERQREKEVIKRRLARLTEEAPAVRAFIEQNVALFNGQPGDPHSFDLLDELLDDQAYRLSYWRVASDEINYRRFFDINELAALSMERPEVFEATHGLILRLLRERKVNGLRIDHPDGLYDPRQYLERLQLYYALALARGLVETDPEFRGLDWQDVQGPLARAIDQARDDRDGVWWRPLYVVVEKILGASEALREGWPIHGTSGYDYLNVLNGLFVAAENAQAFRRLYREATGVDTPLPELVYQKKTLILQFSLSSELAMLAHQLDRLAQKNRWSRDFTLNTLRFTLRQTIADFPVYRSYITGEPVHEADRKYILTAVRRSKLRNPTLSASLFQFIRDMLLLKYPEPATEEDRAEQRRFVGKFQQVTSPVMAKGLEDTAFYVYNRLLSLNEVGGDPDRFGVTPEALHRFNLERQTRWPHALSATSTHDTKRSEDVRARINVLSELPQEWQEHLTRWRELNQGHRVLVEDEWAPDANEEYLLYQTLVGAWPLGTPGAEEHAEFVRRVRAFMEKALHEAKVHTSWVNPNQPYDEAVRQFVGRVLDEQASAPFLDDLRAFQRRVAHYGLFNALSQVLLKITSPGVPDIYQGTELWDFSLVDPDNRRPVDYECRQRLLRELRERAGADDRTALARELVEAKEDGRIKLYTTFLALHCCREHPGLFSAGEYLPASASGPRQEHVFGFVRRHAGRAAAVVVPRLLTRLAQPPQPPLGPEVWQDTRLVVPAGGQHRRWRHLFTGQVIEGTELALAEVLAHYPVALLLAQD